MENKDQAIANKHCVQAETANTVSETLVAGIHVKTGPWSKVQMRQACLELTLFPMVSWVQRHQLHPPQSLRTQHVHTTQMKKLTRNSPRTAILRIQYFKSTFKFLASTMPMVRSSRGPLITSCTWRASVRCASAGQPSLDGCAKGMNCMWNTRQHYSLSYTVAYKTIPMFCTFTKFA